MNQHQSRCRVQVNPAFFQVTTCQCTFSTSLMIAVSPLPITLALWKLHILCSSECTFDDRWESGGNFWAGRRHVTQCRPSAQTLGPAKRSKVHICLIFLHIQHLLFMQGGLETCLLGLLRRVCETSESSVQWKWSYWNCQKHRFRVLLSQVKMLLLRISCGAC